MADTNTLDAWITEQINSSIPDDGPWTPREVAEKLAARLDETDPARFDAWMRDNAVRFLHRIINDRHRSERARTIRSARRVQFRDDAKSGKSLDPYLIPYKVDEETGLTARLGEMTGIDCGRAAEPFERRTAENAMQAEFLRALEKRCGRKKVKNVYERDQLASMLSSLGLAVAS